MGMTGTLPPAPIVCVLTEHREGQQLRIAAEIRARAAQAGTYRLLVVKRGPAGSAQVSQQSEFALAPDAVLQVRGLSLSLEPDAHYHARFSIRVGDTDYACDRTGPARGESL